MIHYKETLLNKKILTFKPAKEQDLEGEKKMSKENEKLDAWDDFISGAFLKAVNVDSEKDAFVCTNAEIFKDMRDNSERPRLSLERNGQQYEFDLNKTNSVKAKELGATSTRKLIGKKIYFKKVLVRNPQTNQEVDGLRIHKIE